MMFFTINIEKSEIHVDGFCHPDAIVDLIEKGCFPSNTDVNQKVEEL
jgi:hypothetical protein